MLGGVTLSSQPLDPAAILATLGVSDVAGVTPVSGGWDTRLWKVDAGGRAYALRVFPPGRERSAQQEVDVMRAVAESGLPVPRIHADGIWRDRPALLLSWCEGRTLLAELSARPWRVWPLGTAFGQMHARVHQVKAPGVLLRRRGAWIGWAGPEKEALQARLHALSGSADALLHLDYHPLNVMTDGTRITGVLDWANALAGDPRADLARTYTIIRVLPTSPGSPRVRTYALKALLECAWRRGYEQVAGPPGDLSLFYVWAGAVMVRDLAPKIGQPGVWLEERHFAQIQRWTDEWRRRAGLT